MAFLSLTYVRRRLYETFLRTHSLAAVALLVLLWLHIRQLGTYVFSCLCVSTSLFVLQNLLWLGFYLYGNFSSHSVLNSGTASNAIVTRHRQDSSAEEIIKLEIDIKRPWIVQPGQFVYVSIPGSRRLGLGILENHPFLIAWASEDDHKQLKTIALLVRVCTGFTRQLRLSNSVSRANVDGPYGGADTAVLRSYDKILVMSSGVGIAAHLFTSLYLLRSHNEQTARVRRLSIVWLLESQGRMISYCTRERN
jgi:predicted ferric reductase